MFIILFFFFFFFKQKTAYEMSVSDWSSDVCSSDLQRADLVVFWAVDPSARYPRYGSRYAVEPHGVAAPQGRKDRTLIAVDVGEALGPADADGRFAIAPADEVDSLEIMRATVQGRTVGEEARFRTAVELARRMTAA